jgi:hypothetical protein
MLYNTTKKQTRENMKESRKSNRASKRFQVDYGVSELDSKGFTKNISIGGLYLASSKLLDVGTRVHLRIYVANEFFLAEGQVVHVKQVPPNLRRIEPQGMGIRFVNPAEIVRKLVPSKQRQSDRFALECQNANSLDYILKEQLKASVLVFPVKPPLPEVNMIVEFVIRLGSDDASESIPGTGRVVQLFEQDSVSGKEWNMVVEVRDVAALKAELVKKRTSTSLE